MHIDRIWNALLNICTWQHLINKMYGEETLNSLADSNTKNRKMLIYPTNEISWLTIIAAHLSKQWLCWNSVNSNQTCRYKFE